MCWVGAAQAQSPLQTAAEIFADADLTQGRISSPSFLRGMVEMCNTDLSLGLFPDEVNSIAAVLNRDHYKFK
jgi:hypothetical protein